MVRGLDRWVAALSVSAALGAPPAVADEESAFGKAGNYLAGIWHNGASDLYLPLYTYHVHSTYSQEQISQYQTTPYGLGYGRSKFDQDGDWHGLYAMTFQDSHYKPSYIAGYAFQKYWRPNADWRIGGGITAFVMARSDTWHYTPFPGALPVGSIAYKDVAIEASYVPGVKGAGNVLLFWGRYHFQ